MTRLQTKVAMAGWGDHRFRGHAVYGDLLGRTSLGQLIALAIGVELGPDEGAFVDELAVSATLADPHIWPLKLTRVAGAHGGSPMPGLAAGLIAADGPLMGAGTVGPAAEWLHRLVQSNPGPAIQTQIRATLAAGGRLPGFGVPARKVDERITALTGCIEARGRHTLPHWSLFSLIIEETRRHKLEPNVASAFAAALLDLGFSSTNASTMVHILVLPCFLANAVEGAVQQPALLRELPSEYLDYRGPRRRESPRARKARE